ncbi:hypothetical protein [Microbacterium jejuense]|uniref:hypothetical protein n=1 Tax=Microbacterium jejuense TaxID=1263637 RepID=UPI0031EC3591
MSKPAARAFALPIALALAGAAALVPAAAHAVESGQVGVLPTWAVSGSSGAYTATPTFPASTGFPATTVTSTGSTLASPSGVTAFLGAGTDFGAEYGTTRSQPYLTLSPAGSSNSVTDISFDGAPPSGWGFALGDIDADWAFIQAFSDAAQTSPLPPAAVGFRSTGNYCAATPKPGACAGGPFTDAPVWVTAPESFDGIDYVPGTLRGNSLPGSPATTRDTAGAYGWFQPDATVRSIRITFGIRDGFPTAQLWLASPAPKVVITGTVTTPDPPAGLVVPEGTTVQIEDPDGTPLLDIEDQPLTVPVDPETGTYTVELEQSEAGYVAEVIVPTGYVAPEPVPLPGLPEDPETLEATAPPVVIEPVVTPTPTPTPTLTPTPTPTPTPTATPSATPSPASPTASPASPTASPASPTASPAGAPQLAESGASGGPQVALSAGALVAAGLVFATVGGIRARRC